MALFAVANPRGQSGQQIKRYVGGLKIPGISLGDVVNQRSECGGAGRRNGLAAGRQGGGVQAGDQSGCNGFDVAFDAADLSGEENLRVILHLQSWSEQRRSIDVSIAVNLAVTQ